MRKVYLIFIFLFLIILNTGCHRHEYVEIAVDPTCTMEGCVKEVCSICGDEKIISTISPLGHSKLYTLYTDPTCLDDGSEKTYCGVCEELVKKIILPATGHVAGKTVEVKSTCVTSGSITTYCKNCYEVISYEELPLTDHETLQTVETPATCTALGKIEYFCTLCHTLVKEEILEKIPHEEEEIIETVATCTSEGLKKIICKNCQTVLKEETLEKIPHEEIEDTQAATCFSSGYKKTYCKNCQTILSEETIPQLSHEAYQIAEVLPTCTLQGKTAGEKCSLCGTVLSGLEVLAPLGHKCASEEVKTTVGHTYSLHQCERCSYNYRDNIKTNFQVLRGYNYLLTAFDNGKKMQAFYQELYQACEAFTYSDTTLVKKSESEKYQAIDSIKISCSYTDCSINEKYNLTIKEAATVWSIMYHENPQFMFLYNGYSTDKTADGHGVLNLVPYEVTVFNLLISVDYYEAETRAKILNDLNNCSKEISYAYNTKTKLGEQVKVIHDYIEKRLDYQYEEDGTTPATAKWAHNLVGFAEDYGGVCECYAKTFLYYCYLFDINAIIVYGNNHSWNMIEYKGYWYGFDLTWNDKKNANPSYTYFGATSSTMKNSGHTPYGQTLGLGYEIPIPTFGSTPWKVTSTTVILP